MLEGYHDRTIFSVAWGEGTVGSLGWIASASGDGQMVVYEVTVSAQASSSTTTVCISTEDRGQQGEGPRRECWPRPRLLTVFTISTVSRGVLAKDSGTIWHLAETTVR